VDREDLNDEGCPLHSAASTHAERVTVEGEPLSRYDYLRIIVRGYSDMGLDAPEPLRSEYQALVQAELAELARQKRQRELWRWYALPKWQQPKFTDVTDV
jgi:hypothetical protein